VLEDEGHMIGANHLPECLRERMAQSPLAVVEDPFEIRLERLREEYFDRTVVILSPLTKRKAGSTASICITVCLPSAVAWGYSVLPSSPPCLMRRWLRSSEKRPPGWCRCCRSYYDPDVSLSAEAKSGKLSFAAAGRTSPPGWRSNQIPVPACGVNALAGLRYVACSGKRSATGECSLEVVAQTHQVHIAQVVGAGGKHVFVVNAETVIQLEADPQPLSIR
jgi:hypothetical protein